MSSQPAAGEVAGTDTNWVEEHREEIEREAASDAPDAWVFQRLLESLED